MKASQIRKGMKVKGNSRSIWPGRSGIVVTGKPEKHGSHEYYRVKVWTMPGGYYIYDSFAPYELDIRK